MSNVWDAFTIDVLQQQTDEQKFKLLVRYSESIDEYLPSMFPDAQQKNWYEMTRFKKFRMLTACSPEEIRAQLTNNETLQNQLILEIGNYTNFIYLTLDLSEEQFKTVIYTMGDKLASAFVNTVKNKTDTVFSFAYHRDSQMQFFLIEHHLRNKGSFAYVTSNTDHSPLSLYPKYIDTLMHPSVYYFTPSRGEAGHDPVNALLKLDYLSAIDFNSVFRELLFLKAQYDFAAQDGLCSEEEQKKAKALTQIVKDLLDIRCELFQEDLVFNPQTQVLFSNKFINAINEAREEIEYTPITFAFVFKLILCLLIVPIFIMYAMGILSFQNNAGQQIDKLESNLLKFSMFSTHQPNQTQETEDLQTRVLE